MMSKDMNLNERKLKLEAKHLVKGSLYTYAMLLVFGLIPFIFESFQNSNNQSILGHSFSFGQYGLPVYNHILHLAIVATLSGLVLCLVSHLFETNFIKIAVVKNILAAPLAHMSLSSSLLLCVLSAVAEEMFFRALLIPYVGIFGSAILYSLVHISPSGIFSAWSLEVLSLGTILGVLYKNTNSLLLLVAVHIIFNIFSMYRYKTQWTKHKNQAFLIGFLTKAKSS